MRRRGRGTVLGAVTCAVFCAAIDANAVAASAAAREPATGPTSSAATRAPLGAAQDAFQRSLESTSRGDYAAALDAVEHADVDPLPRARARSWALHHAGLLDEALAEVEGALALEEDAWLRERAVELAVALHDAPAAERHLQALRETDAVDAADRWGSAVAALTERDRRARRGERWARWVVVVGGALCVGALGLLARGRGARGERGSASHDTATPPAR